MKVLIIGGGGREHALVWKLAQSPRVDEVLCTPGNAGIAGIARIRAVSLEPPFDAVIDWAREEEVGLTVVGPEAPLAVGIVDAFQEAGLRIFGPTKAAAALEASKSFAKDVMEAAGVPTGKSAVFKDFDKAVDYVRQVEAPIVVKADGLAAGKGVAVCATVKEAENALREILVERRFGDAGNVALVEEFLEGREVSVFALCDGKRALPIGTAEDHKRAFDQDEGPNTGGMGSYSPSPLIDDALLEQIRSTILQPTVDEMARRGNPYRGFLYAGLILTKGGDKVLEFNCRFGDPEAQVVLPRLDSDLLEMIEACLDEQLDRLVIRWKAGASLCVVLASEGYPGAYDKGFRIAGLEAAGQIPGVTVFHAGTKTNEKGTVVTAGGRVLAVSALGASLQEARDLAYRGAGLIQFEGAFHRGDIGNRALEATP